jgi:uncharacterized protein DUF6167
MRRLFYVAFGATAGVLIVRRLTKAAESLTPAGMARNVDGARGRVGQALADFVDDVRAGMAAREIELREALGIGNTGESDSQIPSR